MLVMDDEVVVRKVATDMLEFLGYTVTACASGGEMLVLYQQALAAGQPFDLVLMDLTIPGGMGGVEAVRRLRLLDPDACAIVSSGYSNDPVFADPAAFGFQGLVAKPYRVDDLGRAVGAVLRGSRQDLVSGV